jgi:hypothetical protein
MLSYPVIPAATLLEGRVGIFSALADIFSMGKIATGLMASVQSSETLSQQQSFYESQANLSALLGEFNAAVALRSGGKAVDNILSQTDTLVSWQKATYHKRGVEWEGSPQMLAETTVSRGISAALETAYNAQINSINAKFAGNHMTNSIRNKIEDVKAARKNNNMNALDQIFGVGKVVTTAVPSSFLTQIFGAN